ncbi:MAG: hypothetical protein ACPGLV_07095 [Bacteroidia bacterium]
MKKLFSLLYVSFALIVSANAQSLFNIQNPVLSNPAIANYNHSNSILNITQIDNIPGSFAFGNNISYFTQIKSLNTSFTNNSYFSEYFNSYSQNVAVSKDITIAGGKLYFGASGYLASMSIKDENGSLFSKNAKSQLGYGLDLGLNYVIGNHQIGVGFDNVLSRSSLVDSALDQTRYYPVNFRYQTTFFIRDIEIQPYLLYTAFISDEGHTPRVVRNYYPNNYSLVGLSAKYKGFKLGLLTNLDFPDITGAYLSYGAMLGYDFKKLSINYGTRFYYTGLDYTRSIRTISHNLSIRYQFNGVEKGTQLF